VNAQHAVEAEEWMLTALVSTVARTRELGAHARRVHGKRVESPHGHVTVRGIVNGQVLLEDGQHTGALPGRVLWNTLYQGSASA
jgi:hypothetical protein